MDAALSGRLIASLRRVAFLSSQVPCRGRVGHDGGVNPPEPRTATWCDVYMHVPNLGGAITDSFLNALHASDRGLGVIVGTDHFILLTQKPTEQGARKYALDVVAKAARRAETARDQLEGITITKSVARERSLTGRPQLVAAPRATIRPLPWAPWAASGTARGSAW